MKKHVALFIIACLMLVPACASKVPDTSGLRPVSLQLQWITQAQFAGYYVALEKGWYREEGLNVKIKPGGPEIDPVEQVSSEASDFGTAFLSDLSVNIQRGRDVVSIAQIQQMNGLLLISKKSSGIRRPGDLAGKRIGIWGNNWEAQLNALLTRERISKKDVTILPQGFDMEPFLNDEMDVASAMIYNEYHQVLESGMRPQDINIIEYSLYGLGFPGDTLFTRRNLTENDPNLCLKMLRASLRGWQYAVDNPKEAVNTVMKYDETGKANRSHQLSMMREISGLVKVTWREMGYTDLTTVEQMVNILHRYQVLENPMEPEEIYTNTFWEALQK
ncbi:MAG: ABC transporter substrate-binding protein [Dehalococcoidales bacterium]|nr:ABC transporter substrate-binding protein [Dehalococcoidales bacterium]